MIRTLIIDDSAVARAMIRDFLESDDSFRVVGEARDGREGVEQTERLDPDLVTVDMEMPVMNGLEAIEEIAKITTTAIVVVTSHDSVKTAYEATVRGALEFYPKDAFKPGVDARKRGEILDALKRIAGAGRRIPAKRAAPAPPATIAPRRIGAVAIAASTGGPQALSRLCPALPADFPAPIFLVQHNSPGFDRGFAQWLDGCSPLRVTLARERAIPAAGNIYVAPTDRHLEVDRRGFLLDDGEPIHNQKPAADALFKSAAALYGNALVSVTLTGMGRDGADGTRSVKRAGGVTIAQDEESSVIYGMPRAAAETGCVDMVLPLGEIARRLASLAKEGLQA